MFLSNETIANINTQLRAMILRSDVVTVTAICQLHGEFYVRYTTDGEDRLSVTHPQAGQRISDLIADAVRWSDYMLMNEIYSGAENTEEATAALRIWPATAGNNVQPFAAVAEKVRPFAASAEKLNELAERFGGHQRRARK